MQVFETKTISIAFKFSIDYTAVKQQHHHRWRIGMTTVIVSPKYQIVIPRDIRDKHHLIPGQKVQVISYSNRIEVIPEKKISDMRGFLKGIDTSFEREVDRL
jgi:AbrB family looped-hinge helix DNA binding protein